MQWLRAVVVAHLLIGCSGTIGADPPAHDSDVGSNLDPCDPLATRPGVCPPRGLYDVPPTVELRAPATTTLFYTLDGSAPGPGSTPYQEPMTIGPPSVGGVTLLRVAAVVGDSVVGTATHSYLFYDALLAQPVAPAGFPTVWGNGGDSAPGDYEMDPEVLVDLGAARAALDSLPIVSLRLAHDDLWSSSTGIYMNPAQEGLEWERTASLEFIEPARSAHIDCGVRIQGNTSTRDWKSAKLSLRALFKAEYGAGRLEYPLFADSTVESFNTLVLDAHLNLTFTHPDHSQRIRAQYIRDLYASDLQNAVGSLAPHGRFVHLVLNGLYWGLYDLHERPDDAFAASYLGGERMDWDVLKHDSSQLVAGQRTDWDTLLARANQNLSVTANYQAVAELLDIDDFIDYMLVNLYLGNDDWPRHNWYAARRRVPSQGFRFFSWDAEHVVKSATIDRFSVNEGVPGALWSALLQNAEFAAAVRARGQELLAPGAALYVDASSPAVDASAPQKNRPGALYLERADQIRAAMLLESARWGDNRRDEPYTVADWQAELSWALQSFFPQRSGEMASQLP